MAKSNLILIGMPGAGKSTIGVLLAKTLGKNFLDTDLLIQAASGRTLAQIIRESGLAGFRAVEEQYILCLDMANFVIATGGSVVYSPAAMAHLRSMGTVLWLDLPLEELRDRLDDITARGVVIEPGETLESLYQKRRPLYEKYADLKIDLSGLPHEQALNKILSRLGEAGG
jgi:shikimate kinase